MGSSEVPTEQGHGVYFVVNENNATNANQSNLVASLILRLVKKHDNDAEFGDWSGNTATVELGGQQDDRHDSGASGCQPSLMLQPWPTTEGVSEEPPS